MERPPKWAGEKPCKDLLAAAWEDGIAEGLAEAKVEMAMVNSISLSAIQVYVCNAAVVVAVVAM